MNTIARRAAAAISAGLVALGLAACQVWDPGAPEPASPGATPVAPATSAPSRPAGTWHLVFSSTFTGGALNTALWSTGWLANGITPRSARASWSATTRSTSPWPVVP